MRCSLIVVVLAAMSTGDFCSAQIPAFPGAEGFGAVSVGGRGGDVYHVTSLADTNTQGTLRHAVSTAPASGRTIVFDISGNIHLGNSIVVDNPKITIAGQTAPGQGITLTGGTLWLESDDLIVRHIRSRLGGVRRGGQDAISIYNGNRVIIDHSSASWSTDENSSMTGTSTDNTIQWSLITEPLNSEEHALSSLFSPGAYSPPGDQQQFNLSVHHNLYAHASGRNPVLSSYNSHALNIDLRNNVIFDWRFHTTYTGDPNRYINVNYVSNYYVAGLTTAEFLIADPIIFKSGSTDTVVYYNTDNLIDATRDDGLRNGIWDPSAILGARTEVGTPFDYPSVTTQSASDAYESVLGYAGAFWWNRDPVDQRVTTDVHEISDPDPDVRAASGTMLDTIADVGGLPVLPIELRPEDWDTDGDGIPGWWELQHGLDPNVPNNNSDFDNDLYTDLEEYINEVGAFPAPQSLGFTGTLDSRFARSENWENQWQPSRFDTAVISSGTAVVDAAGQHAGTLQVAPLAGQAASLDISSGWLEVADTLEIATAGADGRVNLSGGKLRVGTLAKGTGGSFNFSGGTLSANLISFDVTINGGTLSPGQGVGTTQIVGNLSITAGVLEIELGGTTAGQESDQLFVAGDLTLGGALNITAADGYSIEPLGAVEIIDIQGILTGQFDGLEEGSLVGQFGGRDLFITYQAGDGNDVALFAGPTPGEFNHNGVVDGMDFLAWQRDPSLGTLADWESNYGGLATTDSSTVPEPGGALLLTLATFAMIAPSDVSRLR